MVELDQVAEIRGGATPRRDEPHYWGGDVPWLTPTDLPPAGAGVTDVGATAGAITEDGLASCSVSLLPPGTVLFSSRATIGKIGIATVPLTTNQGFANLIPRAGVESRYLAWCLHFHADRIGALAGSTTFKEVPKSALKRFRIPLPAPSEQRRIVEILDQADHLRRLRAEADATTDRILPALFIKMFGDPSSNPRRLSKERLGELIKVKSGAFLSAQGMGRAGTCPVYGGNGIAGYHSDFMFEGSVIILGRVGAYCGVVHYTRPRSWVTDNALYVAEKREDLEDRYLEWALRTADLNQYAGRAGQPLISGSRVYPVEILIPARAEQVRFEAAVNCVEAIRGLGVIAGRRVQELWEVILHRAFEGALTVSWRETRMQELLLEMEHQARALAASVRGD